MTKPAPHRQDATSASTLSPELIENLNQAVQHQEANELKQAEKLYKTALQTSKHQPDVANLVAIFYQQIGRHKYSITLLNKALKNNPDHAKTHQLLGKSYLSEEQFEKALKHLTKADQLDLANTDTKYLLGQCHHRMGQTAKALPFYETTNTNKNDLSAAEQTDLYNNIADIFFSMQIPEAAARVLEEALENDRADYETLVRLCVAKGESHSQSLKHSINAILTAPTRDEAKALFSRVCQLGQVPSLASQEMKSVIEACLASPNVNHQPLALAWLINFILLKDKATAEQLLAAITFEEFSTLMTTGNTEEMFFDRYFLTGLKSIRSNRIKTERLFTFLRHHLLSKAKSTQTFTENERSLLAAMAGQCFLNEYVFYQTQEEQDFIESLKTKLESQSNITKKETEDILLYACYAPLTSLQNHQTLLKLKQETDLTEVVTTQILEPQDEQRHKTNIKAIGTISDATSKTVRQQYEENPYPRWQTDNFFKPFHSEKIAKQYLPTPHVLIAGCGTGKQIVSTYHFYPNATFTAIDISKASLAYTKRKLINYKIDNNVKLYQCDILDVGQLKQEFDYIECCGVLHHMAEPEAGLKSLVNCLKPNGQMKLALYSTLAREEIFIIRNRIKKEGLTPTPSNIRSFRKALMEEQTNNQGVFPIEQWRDFNTLSECRDLLFHVQETTYTFLELQELLSATGLAVESLYVDNAVLHKFKETFTQPEQQKDLSCWHQFEQQHPKTFAGMIQLMVKRDEQ